MRRSVPLARTSLTLPQPQLDAADQLAARLDRSRSWVFAEAIRRWAEPAREQASGIVPAALKAAPASPPPATIEPAAALRASPAARLRMAQELVAAFRRAHPRPTRLQIIAFESQQDFHAWKGSE